MFLIMTENLLHFLEYFDDKMSSMKNFPLDFEKVRSTVYTRVQVERVYKSNPIFEAKNTTFLEKV